MIKSPKGIMTKERRDVLNALDEAILAADPHLIIKKRLRVTSRNRLRIDSFLFNLERFERIFVIGGGKASAYMAEEVEKLLGNKITAGVVNFPDYLKHVPKLKRIKLNKASHPVPDESGERGVEKMFELVENPSSKDLVICLISGGGSALMPLPITGLTLTDEQEVTSLLLRSGAEIHDLNAVRKHLSGVKGGRLAERLQPATVLSLIISDVVGDDLSSIASGPTVPDETTFEDAMRIAKERYAIWGRMPEAARKVIEDGVGGKVSETPKPGSKIFENVHNILLASNKISCNAAEESLRNSGYRTIILTTQIQGEASQIGGILGSVARDIGRNRYPLASPAALIIGGETTVKVKGRGVGGRNQEVALAASIGINGVSNKTAIASIGTDGVDGPTDAAGAIVDENTIRRALEKKMDARAYLENNDSHTFFKALGDLVVTGPTGTNVNDIMILLVSSALQG